MIKELLKRYKKKTDFCRAVGMTPQYLYLVESGKRPLSAKYAFRIEKITNGEFKASDFIPKDSFFEANDPTHQNNSPRPNESEANV